jgi:VanZ family protein
MSTIFDFSGETGSRSSTIGRFLAVLTWFCPEAQESLTRDQIDLLFYFVRKTAHVVEYALLTLLALRAVQQDRQEWEWRRGLLAALIAIAYACTDEWHQSFEVSRTADVKDVYIDTIGVLLASVLGWLWYRGKRDPVSQLERLGRLRERGVLPDEEFRRAKAQVLGQGYTSIQGTRATVDAPQESATLPSS